MSDGSRELQQRVEVLEQEVTELRAARGAGQTVRTHRLRSGTRRRSETEILGIPLWEIACGPDPERGERRGHAKAIFAMGDIATGVVAVGGIARGFLCIGGVAVGFLTLGGVSLGLLAAMGGLAIGGLAMGGASLGGIAIGGAAIGYVVKAAAGVCMYGKGPAVIGAHVINAFGQDPQAVQFFEQWLSWL